MFTWTPCRTGTPPAGLLRRLLLAALLTLTASATHAQGAGRYYPSDARVNLVTQYGADNTGVQEASGPINQALKDYRGTGMTLYLPAGTYRITQQINYAADNNASMVTLMGAGRGADPATATILSVPDNWGFGGAVIETNANTNMAFGVSLSDLRVSIGSGNPNASGIDYHASNQGTLADVTVISKDGQGYQGVSLASSANGPCLIKNVTVQGFQFGVDANTDEYSFTLEHVTVSGQRAGGAGLRGGGALLAVRDLQSTQTTANVPGVLLVSSFSHLSLIGSRLTGSGGSGFVHYGGHYLLRGVTTSGYTDTYPTETVSDPVLTLQSATSKTLGLAVQETPDEWDSTPADWVAVQKNYSGEDTPNIQAALDAAAAQGKPVVYFPRFGVNPATGKVERIDTYYLGQNATLHVPAGVKYVLGMGCQLNEYNNPSQPYPYFAPIFSFEGGRAGSALYFRDFRNITFEKALMLWQHNTARDLVLAHLLSLSWPSEADGGGAYNDSYGTGALYVEDVSVGPGWQLPKGQKVWARQFNPEDYNSSGVRPLVDNNGATLWMLGFKTEGAGPWLTMENGGATELFGGLNYINTGLPSFPASVVPYRISGASASLDFGTIRDATGDYVHYLQVTRGGTTSFLDSSGLYARATDNPGDSARDAPLFVSSGP